jgi:hypothetical protein
MLRSTFSYDYNIPNYLTLYFHGYEKHRAIDVRGGTVLDNILIFPSGVQARVTAYTIVSAALKIVIFILTPHIRHVVEKAVRQNSKHKWFSQ